MSLLHGTSKAANAKIAKTSMQNFGLCKKEALVAIDII